MAKAPKHDEEIHEQTRELTVHQVVSAIYGVVLDIQTRQKEMDARQQAIRQDFDESSASDKKASLYQKQEE